jgi:two-component system phosphate regulon sensor histidine kinase PhoR
VRSTALAPTLERHRGAAHTPLIQFPSFLLRVPSCPFVDNPFSLPIRRRFRKIHPMPRSADRWVIRPFVLAALASIGGGGLAWAMAPQIGLVGAIIVAAGVPLMAIGGLGLWFLISWVSPTRSLCEAADRMAGGDWSARAHPGGADEIRSAAAALNGVAFATARQLAELDGRRGDLQTLVDALPDPILLADGQHRVALINAPATDLLQVSPQQAIGRRLSNIINDEAILGLLEPLGDHETAELTRHREIRVFRNGHRGTFQAVASPTKTGGLLLVLRDVSTLVGAAQMKTDFVANASHELRTPIAAIKIAFETLADVYREDPTQTERCVGIIAGHLKRLEEMLGDLLDLSRVEAPSVEPSLSPVDVDELFNGLRAAMEPIARQKLVELAFAESIRPKPDPFISDLRLLNLILKNLVENSIKFTPAGGKVSVDLIDEGDSIVSLIVADTGIGVPPEHRERVFERFYQVDPARSGSAGRGTGLGLAIVKHAVHALEGTVNLQSTVGEGTTITCRLPQMATVS